jgi:hypothetical protein
MLNNWALTTNTGSRDNSVSIVSDYGLDDRAIEVQFPAVAKDVASSLCVQTGSGAHPASCPVGTGGPFPGGKARPGSDADHSPHLVPRSWMSRSYTSSPPSPSMACSGTALLFTAKTTQHISIISISWLMLCRIQSLFTQRIVTNQ